MSRVPVLRLSCAANDFGTVPCYGEDKSKSFTWRMSLVADCRLMRFFNILTRLIKDMQK